MVASIKITTEGSARAPWRPQYKPLPAPVSTSPVAPVAETPPPLPTPAPSVVTTSSVRPPTHVGAGVMDKTPGNAIINKDGTVKSGTSVNYDAPTDLGVPGQTTYPGGPMYYIPQWDVLDAVVIKVGGTKAEADDIRRSLPVNLWQPLTAAEATDAQLQKLTPLEYRTVTVLMALHGKYETDRKQAIADAAKSSPAPMPPMPMPMPTRQPMPPSGMNTMLLVVGAGLAIYFISRLV